MEETKIRETFLVDKISRCDLVIAEVTLSTGPQSSRARVEKIYSSRKGISDSDLGADIDFIQAPANWGHVPLEVGDRALIFLRSISGKLYEDAHLGHFLLERIGNKEYAITRQSKLWSNKTIPEEIRSASIQDPKRSYGTAIRFETIEVYVQKLIKSLG